MAIFAAPTGGFPRQNGVVVQLVRIHACHAWGRGFESRPFRRKKKVTCKCSLFLFCFARPCVTPGHKQRLSVTLEWAGGGIGGQLPFLMKYPLYKNIQHFYQDQDDDDNFEPETVPVLEQVFK